MKKTEKTGSFFELTAAKGKKLTDGKQYVDTVATANPDAWSEVTEAVAKAAIAKQSFSANSAESTESESEETVE